MAKSSSGSSYSGSESVIPKDEVEVGVSGEGGRRAVSSAGRDGAIGDGANGDCGVQLDRESVDCCAVGDGIASQCR